VLIKTYSYGAGFSLLLMVGFVFVTLHTALLKGPAWASPSGGGGGGGGGLEYFRSAGVAGALPIFNMCYVRMLPLRLRWHLPLLPLRLTCASSRLQQRLSHHPSQLGHVSLLPVLRDCRVPFNSAGKVIAVALGIASALFCAIGIFGYLAFRSNT
jgi:hypothetical protein